MTDPSKSKGMWVGQPLRGRGGVGSCVTVVLFPVRRQLLSRNAVRDEMECSMHDALVW